MIILPGIFYLLLTRVLYLKYRPSYAFAFLAAAVVMATGTILSTELLSFFELLSSPWVVATWLAAYIAIFREFQKLKGWQIKFARPKRVEKSFVLMAGALFLLVLLPVSLTAIKAAPGTWDSMTYHLARVEHWVQDASLNFYPTNIDRQLWKDDGGEMLVLQLRLLSGSDHWCNIVQLLGFWGCLLSGWAILGLWKRWHWEKLLAVVFMATIPMAILQASSTQVDLIGSFWLMAFVYFVLDFLLQRRMTSLVLCALALGHSLLSRETNYLYMWPFALWLLVAEFKSRGIQKALLALSVMAGGIVLINAGHYARNLAFYHRILSPETEQLVNEHWTFATLVVNAIRNTFMHITTPFIPINDQIMASLTYWTQHLGIQLQDKSSLFGDQFTINASFLDEDYAKNPLHLFLLLALFVYIPFRWMKMKPKQDQLTAFVLALVAGMATFCLILKWQPWNSRLHVSLFMLSTIAAAVMIGSLQKRWVMIVFMIVFILPSLLWVFMNDDRPWIGPSGIWQMDRHLQYYRKQPTTADLDKTAAEILEKIGCNQVGVVLGADIWEYPFWVLMRERAGDSLRLEHVDVQNSSATLAYPRGNFSPCGIYMHPYNGLQALAIGERPYAKLWQTNLPDGSSAAVFIPENF